LFCIFGKYLSDLPITVLPLAWSVNWDEHRSNILIVFFLPESPLKAQPGGVPSSGSPLPLETKSPGSYPKHFWSVTNQLQPCYTSLLLTWWGFFSCSELGLILGCWLMSSFLCCYLPLPLLNPYLPFQGLSFFLLSLMTVSESWCIIYWFIYLLLAFSGLFC
jgi:hypothetical protein